MEKNNKKRILEFINILRKESNEQKHLSISEINSFLSDSNLEPVDRKTLYADFKLLNEYNLNVEYENGYYLLDAPFNPSEIKIIIDSLNSLKNLDQSFLNSLNEKLYSFISKKDVELLKDLEYSDKHYKNNLLIHMENILEAIRNGKGIDITRKDKKEEMIFPVFLHRENDYYYFYYHYQNSNKLYHYRLDNIIRIDISEITDDLAIHKKEIIDHISASSNSFYSTKSESIEIEILDHTKQIEQRLLDDFPKAIKTKKGVALKASVNNMLFGKLCSYGKNIRILNPDIAQKYKDYLTETLAVI